MFIYLVLSSPTGSSDPPETPGPGYVSFRSCSGRGLHGSACYQTDGSLLHCLSTLTLAMSPVYLRLLRNPGLRGRQKACSKSKLFIQAFCLPGILGSLLTRYISVALSLELPPPDVIRRPALWSPDFPHLAPFGLPAANICFTCVLQYNTGQSGLQVRFPAFLISHSALV